MSTKTMLRLVGGKLKTRHTQMITIRSEGVKLSFMPALAPVVSLSSHIQFLDMVIHDHVSLLIYT